RQRGRNHHLIERREQHGEEDAADDTARRGVVEIVRRGRERIAHGFAWRRPGRRGAAHLGGEWTQREDGALGRRHAPTRGCGGWAQRPGGGQSPAMTARRAATSLTRRTWAVRSPRLRDDHGAAGAAAGKAWRAMSV